MLLKKVVKCTRFVSVAVESDCWSKILEHKTTNAENLK